MEVKQSEVNSSSVNVEAQKFGMQSKQRRIREVTSVLKSLIKLEKVNVT